MAVQRPAGYAERQGQSFAGRTVYPARFHSVEKMIVLSSTDFRPKLLRGKFACYLLNKGITGPIKQ